MDDPKDILRSILAAGARRVASEVGEAEIHFERPRNPAHGDLSCNIALLLGRQLKRNPREIAEEIQRHASQAVVGSADWESIEVAGNGFLNFRRRSQSKSAVVHRILSEGKNYGRGRPAKPEKIQVEFVSANPTGPLHVGHGRGAAYGASLAGLLAFAGHAVTREFYINDAGRQMDTLAVSTWLRYLEFLGERCAYPANAYQGEYVMEMGSKLAAREPRRYRRRREEVEHALAHEDPEARLDALIARAKALLGADYAAIHRYALEVQLSDLRSDLAEFGVEFDSWVSEQSLFDAGKVERAIGRLRDGKFLYEKDGALWFRSTDFGDEKDRVVRRENGQTTYFASDIAYHLEKFERGYDRLIDVWGADHHGYIPRVRGALQALGLPAERLTVALVQFAVLYRGGEKVSMSTRAGEFVTLRELREEVGNDAARFFYVLRKSDQHLDFDLDLAKAQSVDNPVYYVQYAHARVCSVFAQWGGDAPALRGAALAGLEGAKETGLMARLGEFPEIVQGAARELSPHLVAFYLRELAGEFHSYYNAERILVEDAALRAARLALSAAVRQVLASGLALLGVRAPETM